MDKVMRARQAARSAGGERALLVVAVVVFAGALFVAWRRLPPIGDVDWFLLGLVVAVGAPLTIVVNAVEYAQIGRLLGHRISLGDALPVSVLSSAANLLPVPGAILVRARALRRLGSTYGRAVSSTALVGLAWLGVTGVLAGGLLAASGRWPGAAFLAGGLALLGAFAYAIRRERTDGPVSAPPHLVTEIVAIETASVVIGAIRVYLVLHALGNDASPGQAMALAAAGILASASGFFPGGLGLREVLSAAISPAVGIPAALGVVVSAVDRITGMAVLALAGAFFAARGRNEAEVPA